jgi:hypothetical protein
MYHRNYNINKPIKNPKKYERSINNIMLKQKHHQSSEEVEGSTSTSRYGSIIFNVDVDDDGKREGGAVVGINDNIMDQQQQTHEHEHQHVQQQKQRNWGTVTAKVMLCIFVISMIIRGGSGMTINNYNTPVVGSLLINNSNDFPPEGQQPTTGTGTGTGTPPGQPFFSWKSWGHGVRGYWDQKKEDWIELEDELHMKVCFNIC